MQKKLMILGAGPNQLPGIKKAVNLGFNVITVDNIPDNVGHKYSHQYVNCSTVDKEGVLKAAEKHEIDGIVTFASDVAIPTLGYVAEQLGLAGPGQSISETMTNKIKFRIFQRENRLKHPEFAIVERRDDLERQILNLTPPLMFKPVDTSGSRGISIVNNSDKRLFFEAFEHAKSYSRSETVCVEEFVNGTDVSGDGFVSNGQLDFAIVTKKYKKDFVVTGHRIPSTVSDDDQSRIIAEVAHTCHAADYRDGPLDFDVRIADDHVTVLEMSPRLGGNGIPMLIAHGTGFDLFTAAIQFSLGLRIQLPGKAKVKKSCGSLIFGTDSKGILNNIATGPEIMAIVPEIFEYQLNLNIGDRVCSFTHGGNSLGYALFDCPPQLTYSSIVAKIKNSLQIRVL